jgi:sporulation protein YlmC with PRC-barrel domain
MKTLKLALLAGALAVTPSAAFAQDLGTTIYGNDGNTVGTVTEVNDQVVVIDTGKHKAPVPVSMVFDGDKGKSVNATKDQVDTMMDQRIAQANAERDAALVQGAAVVSAGGRQVGKLTDVNLAADTIMLETADGLLRMKKEHFAVNPQGQLAVLYSRDQIASAATGGKPAATGGGAR